jgi:hypothetical protein
VPLPYTGNQSNKSNNKDVQVQNGLSHPLGPFWGNAGGMGAFGGPFSPRGRAGFLAISGHKPMGIGKGRPGPARPGPARTEGQSALSQAGRPGPVRTEGQSPLSQADQDQHIVGIIEAQQVELSVVAPSYVESNTDGRDNNWVGRCTS